MFFDLPPFRIKRDPSWTDSYWEYVLRLDADARCSNCYVPPAKPLVADPKRMQNTSFLTHFGI